VRLSMCALYTVNQSVALLIEQPRKIRARLHAGRGEPLRRRYCLPISL
jgi:hypothetical protein